MSLWFIDCWCWLLNLRYLDVSLRLLTLDGSRSHPAHIRHLVHSHVTVLHLSHIIRAVTSVATSRISIYADRAPDTEPLPDDQSLEQCGFVGGPRSAPTSLLLYYDYTVDIGSGCPIVMCDHYFGQRRARLYLSATALPVLRSPELSTPPAPELSASNSVLSVRSASHVSFSGSQMSSSHLAWSDL